MRRVAVLLAVGWSLAMLLHLLSAPLYQGITSSATATHGGSGGFGTGGVRHSTILEVNGPGALGALAFPLVVGGIALVAAFTAPSRSSSRIAGLAGGLVALFSFLGAMTIGVYYLPAALLLLLGAVLPERLRPWRA